ISHSLESVAGESGKRAAETDHHQQSPTRVYERAFRGPDDEEAHDEAAYDVDEERSVGEDGAQFEGSESAQQVTQVGANDGGDGDGKKVFHDGVLPTNQALNFVGVISLSS